MIEIYVLATLALRTAKVHFLVPDVRVWQGSCLLQALDLQLPRTDRKAELHELTT